jgi:WD40 repeat protein/beta-lactamase regulating signal transducer with metallopeptidase domain
VTDYLVHAAISNALMGSIWALVVLVLTRLIRNERVAHALWMLVLVRFLFPPLVPLQFEIVARPASVSGVSSAAETRTTDDEAGTRAIHPPPVTGPQNLAAGSNTEAPVARANAAERAFTPPSAASVIAAAWIAGSLVVFARLCLQAKRIRRLVASAQPAPMSVVAQANQVAADWGLRRQPLVCVIDASASPAVCWMGRAWVLVLPAPLIARLNSQQLRSIISHEYAHLQRKDHWVRWLEAATILINWWNPLAWMACRQLRLAEELCCDGAALRARGESIESYSSALFAVVEMITNSTKTNSPLSLPFANGPFLKRRFEMILQNQYSRSPRFRVAMLLFAAALLPWFPTVLSVAAPPAAATANVSVSEVWSHAIECVAITPDGQRVVGGAGDGLIRSWSLTDGKLHREIPSGEPRVQALHLSQDGRTLLTANKEIRTWNFADGTFLNSVPLQLADAKDYPTLYEFSNDGRLIAGQTNSRQLAVTVWDAATGQIAHLIDVKGYPLCAAFSPDGRYVAIGSVAARGEVKSAGGVHTYDLASKTVVHAISAEARSISAVTFSPDGTLLAGGDHGNGKVTLWTTSDWKQREIVEGHSGLLSSLAFAPNGELLASGGEGPWLTSKREWRQLSEARVWDVASAQLRYSLVGRNGQVNSMAFSPDGKWLVRCDDESLVCEELGGDSLSWVEYFPTTDMAATASP